MLLRSLRAINRRNDVLELPLDYNISQNFFVKEIEGLGPAKATLVSSAFANLDGERYHSGRREARNIIVKLALDPDYGVNSVYDLRNQLYDYFMPKTEVLLKFHMFDRFSSSFIEQFLDVEIKGRVESFEPAMFSKDPAVDISIMCYQPDFVDPNVVIFEGSTVNDLTETTVPYAGTTETGFIFTLFPNRTVPTFTIHHKLSGGQLKSMTYNEELLNNDKLVINSIPGSKSVIRIRNGIEAKRLYALTAQSQWVELEPGDNNIRVHASGAPIPFTIKYTKKYGGL